MTTATIIKKSKGDLTMATNTYETTRYELAEIGARFMALFIDGLILAVIGSIGFLTARESGIGISFLIGLIYYWFFLTRNKGQTPGKALMKLRVIKVDGSPISDSDAVIRYFGYAINSFFLLGWAWAFFDDNHQGWHDKLAKTFVVKAV
jgi:uncharacterized RDD family membrane protein YckC